MKHFKTLKCLECVFVLSLLVVSSCRTHTNGISGNSKPSRIDSKLGIELPLEINKHFIDEIKLWVSAPYKYGGTTKSGVDCSGFVQAVYKTVFNLSVAHQSEALYKKARPIKKLELKEGDLVFFKIESARISHVGMHITKEYFIHASAKKGVVVSNLTEPYYAGSFVSYGTYR